MSIRIRFPFLLFGFRYWQSGYGFYNVLGCYEFGFRIWIIN